MRTLPTRPATPASPTTGAATPTPTPPRPPSLPAAPTRPEWRSRAILDDPVTAGVLYAAWSGDPVTLAPAPPGSGKSRLVALLAATLSERAGLRVAVAAQTREQAAELARRIGVLCDRVGLIWSAKGADPHLPGAAVLCRGRQVRFPDSGGGVLIATTARWMYADHRTLSADVLLVDEAWQATYADIGALGAFAGQVVCVGDPGQIPPVVTGETTRWAESATAPHLPAPVALRAAHGGAVSEVTLAHTWRLGPATTALVQPAFYPGLPFTSRRPPEHLTLAGTALPELTATPVTVTAGPSDPALIAACADRVRALLGADYTTPDGTRRLTPGDVIVVTPHVAQAAAIRATLADLPGLTVGTANAVQGLERPAAVVLHPLAGQRTASVFALDPGRACVMLTRHRAHLTLVTDHATPAVLATAEPTTEMALHRDLLAAGDTI